MTTKNLISISEKATNNIVVISTVKPTSTLRKMRTTIKFKELKLIR